MIGEWFIWNMPQKYESLSPAYILGWSADIRDSSIHLHDLNLQSVFILLNFQHPFCLQETVEYAFLAGILIAESWCWISSRGCQTDQLVENLVRKKLIKIEVERTTVFNRMPFSLKVIRKLAWYDVFRLWCVACLNRDRIDQAVCLQYQTKMVDRNIRGCFRHKILPTNFQYLKISYAILLHSLDLSLCEIFFFLLSGEFHNNPHYRHQPLWTEHDVTCQLPVLIFLQQKVWKTICGGKRESSSLSKWLLHLMQIWKRSSY